MSKKRKAKNNKIKAEASSIPTEDKQVKVENAAVSSPFGQGSACDKGIGLTSMLAQPVGFPAQLIESEKLYYSDWQAQKIVDIPVDDMLRETWDYMGLDEEQQNDIQDYQEKIGLLQILRQALRLERLHGGSAIFIGLADDVDTPETPIDVKRIQKGDLRFLNAVQRTDITRVDFQTDPTLPFYNRPAFYTVRGKKIHISRLLVFDGDPIIPNNSFLSVSQLRAGGDSFGVPILMRLYNSLMQATGSRQAAYGLIQRASTLVFSGDLQTQISTTQGGVNMEQLRVMLSTIDNYNAAMLSNAPGNTASLETLAANFGSVPELIMSYLQVLSAASDIPATRFLGQAPGGLNATGTADLENYYNMIAARQRHRLKPALDKLLRVLLPSAGIIDAESDVKIIFKALWSLSEVENAQVRQIDTQNVSALVSQALISDEEAIEELKLREVLLTNPEDYPPPEREIQETLPSDPQDLLGSFKSEVSDADNSTDQRKES